MSTDGIRTDWANKDFYAELGVTKSATQAEIKKAYRKLARANHPDSNPGDTAKHEKFKAVAEAYDVVGDEEKRTKYDEVQRLYGGGFRGDFQRPSGGTTEAGFDLGDLLRDRAGGFGDLFGDIFGSRGGASRTRARPVRGRNWRTKSGNGSPTRQARAAPSAATLLNRRKMRRPCIGRLGKASMCSSRSSWRGE